MLARGVPTAMRERLEIEKILAEGMLRDYALTPEATLAELRQSYPALPDDALNTVLTAGFADWRLVKGELHFQNDAVANIRKTMSPWLAQFREPAPSDGGIRGRTKICRFCARKGNAAFSSAFWRNFR